MFKSENKLQMLIAGTGVKPAVSLYLANFRLRGSIGQGTRPPQRVESYTITVRPLHPNPYSCTLEPTGEAASLSSSRNWVDYLQDLSCQTMT